MPTIKTDAAPEGLRAALKSDEYTRGWNAAMEHAARIADSLAASAALLAAPSEPPALVDPYIEADEYAAIGRAVMEAIRRHPLAAPEGEPT